MREKGEGRRDTRMHKDYVHDECRHERPEAQYSSRVIQTSPVLDDRLACYENETGSACNLLTPRIKGADHNVIEG